MPRVLLKVSMCLLPLAVLAVTGCDTGPAKGSTAPTDSVEPPAKAPAAPAPKNAPAAESPFKEKNAPGKFPRPGGGK